MLKQTKKTLSFIFCLFILSTSYAQDDFYNLIDNYVEDGCVNYGNLLVEQEALNTCLSNFETVDIASIDESERLGFYINAYNAHVIHQITDAYPLKSVKAIPSFFTNEISVAGSTTTLNDLEALILAMSGDPRVHYLLNCGAKSCPPLVNFKINTTEESLQQAERSILNSDDFVVIDEANKTVKVSKIFQWYEEDFGGNEAIKDLISNQRNIDVRAFTLNYLPYDWRLNEPTEIQDRGPRYQPTLLFDKGINEFKIFANFYTQSDLLTGSNARIRHSFFTNTIQYIFGTGKNLNIGPVLRLRSVAQHSTADKSYFEAARFSNTSFNEDPAVIYARAGISAYGFQLRHEVSRKKRDGFLMIHTVLFPGSSENEGNMTDGFFDWNGGQYTFQSWFVRDIGDKMNIFYDLGLSFENLHPAWFSDDPIFLQNTFNNTVILSWFPIKKTTIYGLVNASPQMGIFRQNKVNNYSFTGFGQIGLGYKYFITDHIELEALASIFLNDVEGRDSQTLNIGIRYNNL